MQSVILVERTAVGGATAQASSAEEVEIWNLLLLIQCFSYPYPLFNIFLSKVREAVTQFLQRQPEEEVKTD